MAVLVAPVVSALRALRPTATVLLAVRAELASVLFPIATLSDRAVVVAPPSDEAPKLTQVV